MAEVGRELAGLAVSVADAARCIREHSGFTLDEVSGCWLWPVRGPGGLGPFRAFYEAAHGPPPEGFRLVHRCSGARRGCVRPAHLDVARDGEALPPPLGRPLAPSHRALWARRLRSEREARGATRVQFARELRVATSTLAAWEDGRQAPDSQRAAEISDVLGWDGRARRYVVTAVVQRVVAARSSGEAALQARSELERDDQPGKLVIARVEQAG